MKKLLIIALILLHYYYSFAQIPSGYYDATSGKSGAELKTALYNIIKTHTALSYDDLWDAFKTTDKKPDGKVWDMYSNCSFTFVSDQCGTYSNVCDCYNREHSFPKSWFNEGSPMNSDLFHLVPTDGKVNGVRSNYPYGVCAGGTTWGTGKVGTCTYPGYSGTVFEPASEYKGDFARNYFYMATRYENINASWYGNDANANAVLQNNNFPFFETWFLNLLGEWHIQDPVSQKEIDRNNEIYNNQQHNRNPFIDHPEYVYQVWGVGASGTITVSPSSLSGFTYMEGSGPSASQNYTIGGTNLAPASGNLSVNGSTNFEVSLNNSTFANSVTIPYSTSTLAGTTVYVRLKAGRTGGAYSNELIVNSGGGAPSLNVSCSGSVTTTALPEPANYPTDFSAHNIKLQWVDATGSTTPSGYLIRRSSVGFAAITAPADGVIYSNTGDIYVPYGQQQVWINNLAANTSYYFKLFAYSGSGTSVDYKIDGSVPQVMKTTSP